MKPDKILILRFSSIGDIILTTAVIEYLNRILPDAELHFITLSDYAAILEGNPNLKRVISVDRSTKLSSLRHLARRLSDFRYDLFLDLHNSLRTKYLRWWLWTSPWVIYRKPRIDRFLLFYLHYNRFREDEDITLHYNKLLDFSNHGDLKTKPTIYIHPHEKERSFFILAKHGVYGNFIGVIPGAAWDSKTWISSRYIQVLNTIYEEKKLKAVIFGSEGDSICDTIAEGVPHAINLKGKTDLRTSLTILSSADLVIGSDTGLVHGAEAVGTPVILINGPTSQETGAKTRADRSIELTAQPWCQPCSKNGSRPCYRKEQLCMTNITPDMVISSFRSLMAEA